MPSLFLLQVLMLYSSRKDSYPKGHASQEKPVQEDKRRGRVSRPVFQAVRELLLRVGVCVNCARESFQLPATGRRRHGGKAVCSHGGGTHSPKAYARPLQLYNQSCPMSSRVSASETRDLCIYATDTAELQLLQYLSRKDSYPKGHASQEKPVQ